VHVSHNQTASPSSSTKASTTNRNARVFYGSLFISYLGLVTTGFTFASLVHYQAAKEAYERAGWKWDVDQDITRLKLLLALFVAVAILWIITTVASSMKLTKK